MKVLLVEASEVRAQILQDQLRGAGSHAVFRRVASGPEIVEALEHDSYDAVLCSSELADLGVASTLEALRRGGDSSPAFVVLDANDETAAEGILGTISSSAERREHGRTAMAQATLDALPEAALLIDFDDRTPVANGVFFALWDLSPEIVACGVREFLAALPETPRLIVELLDGDGLSRSSGTLDLTGGRTVEWTSSPRCIDGTAIGRLWYFRDVTAAARAQQALEASEEKYRSLIGNAPAVLWTADAEGRITFVSPNVFALDGHTPEEVCAGGKNGWLARVHPDEQRMVARTYAGLYRHDLAFDVEYRVRHKNGSWIWVHDRAVATYEAGGIRHADGVMLDVTARKLAELESGRLTYERELLFDSAAEGIYGMDRDGRATFVNRAAVEILGYQPDEVIGRFLHDLVHGSPEQPCHRSDCAALEVLRSGERRRAVDEVFRRKDGSTLMVEMNAAPIVDGGDVCGAVVIFSDTTERRALELSIEQARRVESLGRVAATMAHEFNNVLSAISPFGEIVGRLAGDNALLRSAADHIASSIARGRRVTDEILRFTRTTPAVLQPVELASALRRLVCQLQASLPGTCSVELRVHPEPITALADWPQIEQVITNLVFNARDAMEGAGTVILDVCDSLSSEEALRRVEDSGSWVHIRCVDSGCGMTPDVAARVFEPMFTTKRNGTGIGLAVAQQLVSRNQGMIYVESEAGRGTTFHLLLRRAS